MVISRLSASSSVSLDLMRLLLAQMVVLGHAASFNGLFAELSPPNFPWLQSVAVIGFFILSGFVIMYSTQMKLERNAKYSFKEFFIERFSRIYAGLVPALACVYIIDTIFIYYFPEKYIFYGSFDWGVALKNMLMLEKYPIGGLSAPMFGSASTWWSLAIEWWFYMFFGWVVLKNRNNFKSLSYMLILFAFAFVPLKYLVAGQSTIAIGISYVWLAGAVAVVLREYILPHLIGLKTLGLSIVFFVLAGIRYQSSGDAYDLLAAFNLTASFMFMVVYLDKKESPLLLRLKKPIHFIAGYSLTLYLVHYSILWFIHAMSIDSPYLSFVIGFVISNVIAIVVAVPTEMKYHQLSRFLKLKFVRI